MVEEVKVIGTLRKNEHVIFESREESNVYVRILKIDLSELQQKIGHLEILKERHV